MYDVGGCTIHRSAREII